MSNYALLGITLCVLQSALCAPEACAQSSEGAERPSVQTGSKQKISEKKISEQKRSEQRLAKKNKSQKPTTNTDDLWAVSADDGIGSAGLVNFEGKKRERFNWDKLEREPSSDKVFIEHHGYFRFRADMLHRFDLGTYDVDNRLGTSQYLPPLTAREGSNRKESSSLSSANIRFRYRPIFHISEQLRIHATLDLPDNLVLGTTPDGGVMSTQQRPDALLSGLSGGQVPLEGAARLRHMWGVWESEMVRVDLGRMRHNWGLGILANDGSCFDCDYGDIIDRVQVSTQLFNIYLALSWDLVDEGPSGFGVINQVMGQAWDWDQRDDVDQYSIAIGQYALSAQDHERNRSRLRGGHSVFEWGFYGILRTQQNAGAYLNPESAQGSPTTPDPTEGNYTLYPARLELMTPDVFLSWRVRPSPSSEFSLKVEAVGQLGNVEFVPLTSFAAQDSEACRDSSTPIDQCASGNRYSPRERSIEAWGYALELDARSGSFKFGLHHGGASGDDQSGYFGGTSYLQRGALADPSVYDPDLNGFRFDRDYIVDMILFREVLGGVHNALYFKPYLAYEFKQSGDQVWGAKASAIYGMALNEEYTAGGEAGLGVEFDLEAYIVQTNRFRFSAAYGVLMPLSGLDLRLNNVIVKQAELAQTFQLGFGLMF